MKKILMYHSVGPQACREVGAQIYAVSEELFRKQMEHIKGISRSPGKHITVTFDDGLLDNYTTAFPILKELGLKAFFFVLAGKLDQSGYVSSLQIKEMSEAGMVIGSHGMSHKFLTDLSDEQLHYELSESKRILESSLGFEIGHLSIPRGFADKRIIDKAREIGYEAIFSSYQADYGDFVFGRIPVKCDWDLEHFIYVVNRGLTLRERSEEFIKTFAKKMLGAKAYDKIRTRILSTVYNSQRNHKK